MINLVAPKGGNSLTGGHLVNSRLCEHSRIRLIGVESLQEPDWQDNLRQAPGNSEAIFLDSLFLTDPGAIGVVRHQLGTPLALIAHSLPSLIPLGDAELRLRHLAAEKAALPLFDFVVAPSSFLANAIAKRGFPRDSIFVVTPAPIVDGRDQATAGAGDDTPATTGGDTARTSAPAVQILTVANWNAFKGIAEVWDALSGMPEPDWHWTVAGSWADSEFGRSLRDSIVSTDLSARVSIRGPVAPSAMNPLFRSADLFVLPSAMESYGLAYAEAISHGLPVIAAGAAAAREVLAGIALLVPAGDRTSLSRALADLIGNPEARSRMSAVARSAAAKLPRWPQVRSAFLDAADEGIDQVKSRAVTL